MREVLVLAERMVRRPYSGAKISPEYYLLKSPAIVCQFGDETKKAAKITKACTFAWASSLAGLAARVPKGAVILDESDYCYNAPRVVAED